MNNIKHGYIIECVWTCDNCASCHMASYVPWYPRFFVYTYMFPLFTGEQTYISWLKSVIHVKQCHRNDWQKMVALNYISIKSPLLVVYVYLQKPPIHWSNPYVMILKSCFWLWHLYVQLVYSTFLVALSPLSSCSQKKTALAASSVLDPPLALHHSIVKYEVAAPRRVSLGHRSFKRYDLGCITSLPSGKLTVRYGKSPFFNGKIHYFYGHVQELC